MVETRGPHAPRAPQLGAVGVVGDTQKQSITTMVNIRRLLEQTKEYRPQRNRKAPHENLQALFGNLQAAIFPTQAPFGSN